MPTTRKTKRHSKDSFLSIDLRPFKHPNGNTYQVIGTSAEPHTHDLVNRDTGETKEKIPHETVKKWQSQSKFVNLQQ